jgi:copper resistance protein C
VIAARPRTATSRAARTLLVLAAALGAVLGTATSAQAHASLTGSNPPADATVTTPVDVVELTFSASVLLREVTVTGPGGADVTTAPATASAAVVTAPVSLAEAGEHTVTYSAMSSDGHPLDGTMSFTYAPPVAATPSTPGPVTVPPVDMGDPVTEVDSKAAASSSAENDGGLPAWVVPGVIAVLAVAGFAMVLVRRRSGG